MDKQNLNIYEQMGEFMTTNGDEFILPYLNKFDKATLSQGMVSMRHCMFLASIMVGEKCD